MISLNITDNPNLKNNFLKIPNISFGEGKVLLLTDYDGTYAPEGGLTEDVFNDRLLNNFKEWDKFVKESKGDFKLGITTGRNAGEIKLDFSKNLRSFIEKGMTHCIPSIFIGKNGGEKHVRDPETNIFGGIDGDYAIPDWPNPGSADKTKKELIEKLSGWNIEKVQKVVTDALKKWDLTIVKIPHTHYGNEEKSYGFIRDAIKEAKNNEEPWMVSKRDHGDFSVYIGLPKCFQNEEKKPEKNTIIRDIQKGLKGIGYHLMFINKDSENTDGPSITVLPKFKKEKLEQEGITINGIHKPEEIYEIDDNCEVYGSPEEGGTDYYVLNKAFDVAFAIKEARENNDLVITACNGSNDVPMLNPKNFVDSSGKLPFMSVTVFDKSLFNKPEDEQPKMLKLYKKSAKDTVIQADSHYELLEAVKKAIKTYAKKTPEFDKVLSVNLKQ